MQDQYLLNNITTDHIAIPELRIVVPPGVHDVFELNNTLTRQQLDYSLLKGSLCAAIDNGFIFQVKMKKEINVIIRKPIEQQVFENRARFSVVKVDDNMFSDEDLGLFNEETITAARDLNTEQNSAANDLVKPETVVINQEKIKNDLKMGFVTCGAKTASGTPCKRPVIRNASSCSIHTKTSK